MERNGGTYIARNTAFDMANGEFVTCQDADDWSHPRRIERQVTALLDNPKAAASRSYCFRVREDLGFQRPGYPTSQENAVSLMVRRDLALATIGYFDTARKGADTEYRKRLELATGQRTIDLTAPLSMYRMGSGSLSRADFTPGWHHVSRFIYRGAYDRWHRWRAATGDFYLPRFQEEREFALPQRFQIDQAAIADSPPEYDVVVLSDWRQIEASQQALLTEIEALIAHGYRVGVTHRESFDRMRVRREPLDGQLLDLINAGTVDFVALDQSASASLLIVGSPELMQFAPADPSTVDIDRVLVVADRAPGAGDESIYRPEQVDGEIHRVFGRAPTWCARSATVAAVLSAQLPSERVHTEPLAGIVDLGSGSGARTSCRSARPVLGARLAATPSAAATDRLLACLPDDDSVEVRIYSEQPPDLAHAPIQWIWMSTAETVAEQFLDEIDFYVDVGVGAEADQFDPEIAHAIARGCIALLPPEREATFGDAARYGRPEELRELSAQLCADPQAFALQSEQGVRRIEERHGRSTYLTQVSELIGPARGVHPPTGMPPALKPLLDEHKDRPVRSQLGRSTTDRDATVVLLATEATMAKISSIVERVEEDESLMGLPVVLVHPASLQVRADRLGHEHPEVRRVTARSGSAADLAAAAIAAAEDMSTPFIAVADLSSERAVRRWGRSVRRQILRYSSLDIPRALPLLLWTRHCTREVLAAYLHRSLTGAGIERGPLADYLGGLTLAAGAMRLDGLDPADGAVDLVASLNARTAPDMPQPPWRYRFLLTRSRAAVVHSEPTALASRLDKRGRRVWESLRTQLPLSKAPAGNFTLEVEVVTDVEQLRLRRPVLAARGVLQNARTVDIPGPSAQSSVRYLVHSAGPRSGLRITLQRGRSTRAQVRWATTLVRKDVGFLMKRRGSYRVAALRMLRLLTKPWFAGRDIWLIGERTDTAQDNGAHLFSYLRREHPDRRVYYIIDEDSPQRDRVSGLGNVIMHSSWRHQLLMLHARVLVNAYSIRYLVPRKWGMANYTQHLAWRIGALRVYLKHGVHLNPLAFTRGQSGYDLVLTAMPRETQALREFSGYDAEVREIGMPRYDGLVPTPASRTVLFMPTWRQYLVPRLSGRANPGQIEFVGSRYQQFISRLLGSPRLHAMLEKHDYTLTFLPHYNLASYFDSTIGASDRLTVADTNTTGVQDLLRTCDAFITDYSSVHFDVAYLGTPVVYARFDEADYESHHAATAWFDYRRDGYGPVTTTVDETLDELEAILERGGTVADVYAERARTDFTYRDRRNSERTVQAIDELAARTFTNQRGPTQ
ncbi:CDP-glycerol glycerophosphotransferase, TagB/SpsB family [Ruania alba]|uniref:CDP-glycerol glycerophosphotransferase, TagB/SpsB family n=2 Tax=Ruania alba TaxID=648782 RepID=A0A1H5NCS5_9MICO|nr:CDP-glycerol glycerophosphotransferase, TagB/SpsB family [Ruania alba]